MSFANNSDRSGFNRRSFLRSSGVFAVGALAAGWKLVAAAAVALLAGIAKLFKRKS